MLDTMKLYTAAVPDALLDLLRELMTDPRLRAFHLVGGTALALRFGHRQSIDIDLFTAHPFDAPSIGKWLESTYPAIEIVTHETTVLTRINGIKVDLIAHQYPLIDPPESLDNIRFLSVKDIAAMKLNAIANRGSKKGFWDYALLLEHFDRGSLLSFFHRQPHPRPGDGQDLALRDGRGRLADVGRRRKGVK
jgi:hypothetical protein